MRKRATSELPIYRPTLSRRSVIAGLPLLVAACADSGRFNQFRGAVQDGAFKFPEIGPTTIAPVSLHQIESTFGHDNHNTAGTLTPAPTDLLTQQARVDALRYAVGVGRTEALNFRGSAVIGRKETWPRWTPTAHMMAAMPQYRPYAGGMDGGPDNPLGARALYLYRNGRDTYFRLHGTNEPESIGHAVSSGCIRLLNEDIIDLYNRVSLGTPVAVVQS